MLRVGTTEGRFRMIMPDLMLAFEAAQAGDGGEGEKQIRGYMEDAVTLHRMLSSGGLDLAFCGLTQQLPADTDSRLLLDEQLFFVISEGMLRKYRPEYLQAAQEGNRVADMRDFSGIPVCRSLPNLHCMQILDEVLDAGQAELNCVHVSGQIDLHLELAARDYAACFCLGMYLPYLQTINGRTENKLHAFRIRGLEATNPVFLLQRKDRQPDPAAEAFIRLLEEKCREIAAIQDSI